MRPPAPISGWLNRSMLRRQSHRAPWGASSNALASMSSAEATPRTFQPSSYGAPGKSIEYVRRGSPDVRTRVAAAVTIDESSPPLSTTPEERGESRLPTERSICSRSPSTKSARVPFIVPA